MVAAAAPLAYAGGALAHLAFQGTIELNAANAALQLNGGVVVTGAGGSGPGAIDLRGAAASLTFFDPTGTTTNGIDNVTITAGNSRTATDIVLENFDDAAETVTFGANARIVSAAKDAQVLVDTFDPGSYAIINAGEIEASAAKGSFTVAVATFENDGRVTVANGDDFTLVGALRGSGRVTIETGGVAEFGQAGPSQTIVFADATGRLDLTAANQFAATIAGAVAGDAIDLIRTAATSATLNAKDQLVIADNGATVATIQLAGDYAGVTFHVASDGAGGSLVTLSAGAATARSLVHGLADAMAALPGSSAVTSARAARASDGAAWMLARPFS